MTDQEPTSNEDLGRLLVAITLGMVATLDAFVNQDPDVFFTDQSREVLFHIGHALAHVVEQLTEIRVAQMQLQEDTTQLENGDT